METTKDPRPLEKRIALILEDFNPPTCSMERALLETYAMQIADLLMESE